MQVLFHIDAPASWDLALGNAQNMLAYGQEHQERFEIELVANGPAVVQLREDDARAAGRFGRLDALAGAGVRICACANALRANGIGRELLCPFVAVVPAGVVEIAHRQREGYAYIKP